MPNPDQDFAKDRASEASETRHRSGINPNSQVDIKRLRESMQWSAKMIDPFRGNHETAVKYFAGSRYGGRNDIDKTPMNLMRLAIEIWLRQLVAQTPKALVLTRTPNLRTDAYELELATEHLLDTIRFGDKLSDNVRSALFSMGVMKVGISDEFVAAGSGFTRETGQPYAEPILFEDWLHDMNARNIEEWDWAGNKYRVPYEVIMENPDFDPAVKAKIQPEDDSSNAYGESFGEGDKSTHKLSAGESLVRTEYRQHVELWDIWLPGDNLFVTIPAQDGTQPLRVREWEGPEHGPYHILSFTNVPGNVMPSAPAQHLIDLQDIITRLFNHMSRQAERQKTLTVVDGRADADGTAEAIMEGEDGQVIKTNHIDGVKELKYGGVDQSSMAYVVWLREVFSYLGGNIDAMGGLAQQAGTLGQEELLVQSSSEMMRDMQSKVEEHTERVISDLTWYMYTDPLVELPLVKRIEGFGDIPFIYGPEDREQDFFNYQFKIHPHSLQRKGPAQRLKSIMDLTSNVFIPLAPQMEQWGMTMNFQKLVEIISKYSDLPEINEIIEGQVPTMAEIAGMAESSKGGDRPTQSPTTNRNYTRKNVSTGGTRKAQDDSMIKSLMSAASSQGQGGN